MNRITLLVTLILLSVTQATYAQQYKYFDYWDAWEHSSYIPHKHMVILGEGNTMTIRLWSIKDYEQLDDINSILSTFMKDISFYRDSLDNTGAANVKIDYILKHSEESSKMRFKVYQPEGDPYVRTGSETAKLKLGYDTIHIVLINPIVDTVEYRYYGNKSYSPQHITFVLKDYKDIEQLIQQNKLQGYIDTLAQATVTKKKEEKWNYYTTAVYRPGSPDHQNYLQLYHGKTKNVSPSLFYVLPRRQNRFVFNGNIGAGLVRNKLAPTCDIGLEFRDYWFKDTKEYSIFGLYVSPYFLFEKDAANKYHTYDNWFVNIEVGSGSSDDHIGPLKIQRFTVGVGYLINPDNLHFEGTTMKIFSNLNLAKGVTLSPEIISTDNFKSYFPGLTIKVL